MVIMVKFWQPFGILAGTVTCKFMSNQNQIEHTFVRRFNWIYVTTWFVQQHQILYRSIVELSKLTPLIAEKPILTKYFGKQKRFTNAVNVMKKIIRNVEKESNDEIEKQRLIKLVNQKVLKIVLKRLTPEEIERYSNVKKSKSKLKSKPTPPQLSVVLRKRQR